MIYVYIDLNTYIHIYIYIYICGCLEIKRHPKRTPSGTQSVQNGVKKGTKTSHGTFKDTLLEKYRKRMPKGSVRASTLGSFFDRNPFTSQKKTIQKPFRNQSRKNMKNDTKTKTKGSQQTSNVQFC